MTPKTFIPIIFAFAIMAIIILPIQAMTITFANPNGIAERDYMIYNSTGQMVAFVNSTSVVTLDDGVDYIFMMKPVQTNPLEDPTDWLTNTAFPFLQSNVIAILLIFIAIGFVVARR